MFLNKQKISFSQKIDPEVTRVGELPQPSLLSYTTDFDAFLHLHRCKLTFPKNAVSLEVFDNLHFFFDCCCQLQINFVALIAAMGEDLMKYQVIEKRT